MKKLDYPYPVLGCRDDIMPAPTSLEPEVKENAEDDTYDISFQFDYSDDTIRNLVKSGKAVYCCEVECSHTFFRHKEINDRENITFSIPRTKVGKDVEMMFSIVAVKDIEGYSNPQCHEDYAGFTFDLKAGDVLAVFGYYRFFADLKAHQFNATGDFLSIKPYGEGVIDWPTFKFNEDKVILCLPSEMYSLFDKLKEVPGNEEVLMSSFALQALTEAIHALDRYSDEEYKWVRALKTRIEAIQKTEQVDPSVDAYKIAQIILSDRNKKDEASQPFMRMLLKLKGQKN